MRLHFFNPVPLMIMRLLVVIKTIATRGETLETGKSFGKSLGKTVIAPDTPCFIVNRLGIASWISAVRMVEDGIASKEDSILL